MYETRCERQEREIFALERQLEEKTSGVETAMSVARRQIKWQEERYDGAGEGHGGAAGSERGG